MATKQKNLLSWDDDILDSGSVYDQNTSKTQKEVNADLRKLVGEEFHVGVGQQYTTLRAGIEAAVQKKNSKVIIHPGVYDMKNEFADVLSAQSITEYKGNALYNGVHVIGLSGAVITAIFTGSESNIWQIYTMFSPFFAVSTHENNDYTLENVVIRANNCRYCVHDDPYGEGTYVHKYINCDMGFYNAMSPANYVACIGGGLGEHSTIIIEGGSYESTTSVARPNKTIIESEIPISYHNSILSTAQSWLYIRDVELRAHGHFEFYPYGSSTQMTYVRLSGCRAYSPTVKEPIDSSSVDNMQVDEFNMVQPYGQQIRTEMGVVPVTQGNNFCYVGANAGYNLVGAIFSVNWSNASETIIGIAWSGYNYILFLNGPAPSTENRNVLLTWIKNN